MSAVADLSVLMPTYNHAHYLPRALDAILTQSVQPREIIVVDDCSTDETPKILAEYAGKYLWFRTIRNDSNQGVNRSVHRAFEMARGKYVYFPGSDDFILPGFIEKSMAVLERHPEAGLCCSYHSTIDGITGEIRPCPSRWCESAQFFAQQEVEYLLRYGGIAGHTSILRRDAVAAAGIYLPDLEWHADLFLNQVVAFRHGVCHVPEMLALLTVMPGTYSTSSKQDQRLLLVLQRVLDWLLSERFADVAGAFRRSSCLSLNGPHLIQAAATRQDIWSKEILGFLNGLNFAEYNQLMNDPNPTVRELACLFLGKGSTDREVQLQQRDQCIQRLERQCKEQHRVVLELCERVGQLDSAMERANHRIAWMESTRAWRFRSLLACCKSALFGLLMRKQRV